MSKKISDVSLTKPSLGAICQFYANVNSLITAAGAEVLHIETQAAQFAETLTLLQAVMNKQRALDATAQTTAQDDLRDHVAGFMAQYVNALTFSPITTEAEAALRLKNVFDSYPSVWDMEQQEETALLNKLLTDLSNKADDVETLRMSDYVATLSQANARFSILSTQRNQEALTRSTIADGKDGKTLRQELANQYRTIVPIVNAFAIATPAEAIDTFIDGVNAEILQLKNVIATEQAARTRAANAAKAKEEGTTTESGEAEA